MLRKKNKAVRGKTRGSLGASPRFSESEYHRYQPEKKQTIRKLRVGIKEAGPLPNGERARSNEVQLHQVQLMVRLLQDIAVAANEADSLTSAFHYALNRINRQLGWVLGHAYQIDEDGVVSSPSIWTEAQSQSPGASPAIEVGMPMASEPALEIPHTHSDGVKVNGQPGAASVYPYPAQGRFEVFKAVSDALRFHPEASLPGVSLNRGQPVWLNHLPENSEFSRTREARFAGLRTALAIPIMAGKKLVGILEFFHEIDLPPDPTLMAVLPHVGVQLGRVVERCRSEDALRQAAAQLHMIMTNLPVFLWVTDREGSLLIMEGKEITEFQSQSEGVLGKTIFEQSSNRPMLLEQVRRALAGNEIHTEIAGEGGSVFETYLMPYYDANWAVDGIIGLAFNISERKRMEFELDEMRHRLLDSIDSERARLAAELHEGPLQDLYGAYYQIQEIKSSLDKQNQEIANRVLSTIQGVNATLRIISGELHPNTLVHLGLAIAIRSHAARLQERLEHTTLHLDLQNDSYNLPTSPRLGLYRAYQQLINNAVRHAAASDIWVRLRFDPDAVVLEVQDNGRGFENPTNWVELVRRGRLGLASTSERVQGLNGSLQIDTHPGQGTLARVTMPHGHSA